MAMYGTRDAAQNWEETSSKFMRSIGFRRGKASPRVVYHLKKNISAVIHRDDFTLLGSAENLDWSRDQVGGNFEVQFRGRYRVLEIARASIFSDRIVSWTAEGIRYEPDQRHAQISMKQLGVDGKKTAVTLGIKPTNEKDEEGDGEFMEGNYATRYRAMTARGNILEHDRSDIRFAVKELSRHMAKSRREN
jgi:hypothetical protein